MITEEFKKTFTNLVEGHEGNKLKIYDDGFGIPTIGIGFALINKISDRWEAYDQKELQKKGINLTIEQHKIIENYAEAKSKGRDTSDLRSQLNDIDVTITPETARKLLQHSIQDKYDIIIVQSKVDDITYKEMDKKILEEYEQEVEQRYNTLKEMLAPGESLHDVSITIKVMKQGELYNLKRAYEAQLKEVNPGFKNEIDKLLAEYGERATQLQVKVDAKNKKIDTMVHEYHKKMHEFIDKTSRCIVQASDNDDNIENVIDQQINLFLQGAALDLSTAVDLSIIDLTI